MTFEEVFKQKTDEMVERMRTISSSAGQTFTERDEAWYRSGISAAISIIGIGLGNLDENITNVDFTKLFDNKKSDDYIPPKHVTDYNPDKCPHCINGNMVKITNVVLTTNPPKYVYECNICGYYEYRNN